MAKENLGIRNGKLAPCPNSPNCVSTQADNADKKMEPFPFQGDMESTKAKLKEVITNYSRTTIVEETEDYIHATCQTKIMKFTDDVEFYLDEENQVVHFRSASRTGYSDLGKNRQRMDEIGKLYQG
ncbi:DUF1499 domain-containing protein [Pontibacillus salicampi]|uniref:DUF1499 domain-containing protein n=1 Tax=Pontibacillus salicampi TaxID=1449801 RepID=A0ABV6LLS9_9BACI